ncbi:MAG: glycosyltransferase family protein [Clostridia bacterium]|nr:glycosyltransferase family protein [Clostridia bacterium]
MKPYTVAIVQARMGSTRLPGKVLLDLAGSPLLLHVVRRIEMAEGIDRVVIATSEHSGDDAIVEFARKEGIDSFRGSEEDVLARYHLCAEAFGAERVVRMTSDNPLLCPRVLERHLRWYEENPAPYSYTTGYPVGLCGEIFTPEALREAYENATEVYEREHVSPYLRREGCFVTAMPYDGVRQDLPEYRLTVDTREDLEMARLVYGALYHGSHDFGMEEVIRFLDEHPEVREINRRVHQKRIGE